MKTVFRVSVLMAMVVIMAGCSTSGKKIDRHEQFYSAIEKVAAEQRASDEVNLRLKVELVKALFGRDSAVPGYTSVSSQPADRSDDLVKIMATMMIFNDHHDPRRLQYALERIPAPAPTIGERISDGVFRVLPSVIGISAAAYGGYLIKKAGEFTGGLAAGTGQTLVTNSTTTNEHYNVNSNNSQNAEISQSNSASGGGGTGSGGRMGDSHNQGNGAAIGQGMAFEANNPAMRSGGYQAPYGVLPTAAPPAGGPSILPVQ